MSSGQLTIWICMCSVLKILAKIFQKVQNFLPTDLYRQQFSLHTISKKIIL